MKALFTFSLLAALFLFAGCGQSTDPAPAVAISTPLPDAGKFLLADEPAGAQGIIDFRKQAQDNDEVVIVGRIGGDKNPWVDGRAAFMIVDTSLKPCNEIEGDMCPKPWDYCCETPSLPRAKVMIKLVDDQGQTVPTGAKQLLTVKELDTVVVRGKAKRDEAGNITVLASGLFIRK